MAGGNQNEDTTGGLRRCDAVLYYEGATVGGRFQALVHRDAAGDLEEREEHGRFPAFLFEEGEPRPVESVAAAETAEPPAPVRTQEDREAVRDEVFRGLMGYVFGAGIHPAEVLARGYSAVRMVRREWIADPERIPPAVLRAVWQDKGNARQAVAALWRPKDRDAMLAGAMERLLADRVDAGLLKLQGLAPAKLADLVRTEERRGVLRELVDFITKRGRVLDPVGLGRRWYGIGKALAEEELDGASLQVLADLSGETRAIWSLRIIDLREELEAMGIQVVRFAFQKSTESVAAYAEAQRKAWASGKRKRKASPVIPVKAVKLGAGKPNAKKGA